MLRSQKNELIYNNIKKKYIIKKYHAYQYNFLAFYNRSEMKVNISICALTETCDNGLFGACLGAIHSGSQVKR